MKLSKKQMVLSLMGTMLLTSVALTGCGSSKGVSKEGASSAKPAPIVIRLGDVVAEDNPETTAEKFFAKRVSELTDGRYEVKVYSNAVLGPHTSMNKQVSTGSLEMTVTSSADLAEFDKSLSILSLPYLFDSKEKLFKAEDGNLGKAYGAIAEKYGLKIIGFFDSGSRNIYNKKGPIQTPDDIKKQNLRLRAIANPVMIDTLNTLGAQTVPLNTSEIYNAISQGVVDGAENSITFYLTQKHNEIAQYFSLTNHFFSIDPFMVSLKWFNSLPADIQKSITQAGEETIKFEREEWAKVEEENFKKAESLGAKINKDVDIAAFQKKVQPVWEKYGTQFGELYQILKDSQ
ncbi:MAG: TRAP transporter substrate-binding protein [Paenibacillaceae bacterium]